MYKDKLIVMMCFICNGATKVVISGKLYWCDNCINSAIGGRLTTPEETIEEAYAKSVEAKIASFNLTSSTNDQDNPFASIASGSSQNPTSSTNVEPIPILPNGEKDPTYCQNCHRSGSLSILTEYKITTQMDFGLDLPDYQEEEIQIHVQCDTEEEIHRNSIESVIQCSHCGTTRPLEDLPFFVEFI